MEETIIRNIKTEDIGELYEGFREQGWHKEKELFEMYFAMQESGKRDIFVAQVYGKAVGYTTLIRLAKEGPFKGRYPEIVDFNVLIKYQRMGIGSKILDKAESKAKEYCNTVSLGVGLHYGYGSAQRMYVKRGYIPDGSGVWYLNKRLEQYADCVNDDDLVLYFSKEL